MKSLRPTWNWKLWYLFQQEGEVRTRNSIFGELWASWIWIRKAYHNEFNLSQLAVIDRLTSSLSCTIHSQFAETCARIKSTSFKPRSRGNCQLLVIKQWNSRQMDLKGITLQIYKFTFQLQIVLKHGLAYIVQNEYTSTVLYDIVIIKFRFDEFNYLYFTTNKNKRNLDIVSVFSPPPNSS